MKVGNSEREIAFDKEKLYNYVKTFSFPRLTGTEGEEKAVELTIDCFKNIGFTESQIHKESFEFSDFYSTTLMKLIMVITLTFSLFILLFVYISLYLTIFIVGAMTIFVFLIIKGLKHPEDPGFWGEYYGSTISATNVYVKIPAKILPEEKAGNIIISAHLDSKSQTFKTFWRIFFYRIWLYGGIFLGGFLVLLFIRTFTIIKISLLFVRTGMWIFTIIVAISNIFLMSINTHNKSSGSLDNATGMSVVFELSKYFKKYKLNNFNTWFCQFSAEELGTMGSRFFVNNHEENFVKGRIFQINLEMISCASQKKNQIEYLNSYGVLPRKKIAPLLCKYLDKAAHDENIKIKGFHISIGAHTDSVPFHLRGYDSIDLVTRDAGKYTHTKLDTPDRVDPKVLRDACLIVKHTILSLDKDFDVLCKS